MKSRFWAALLAMLLLACAGLSVWLLWPGEQAQWAQIWSDGVLIETVELAVDRVLIVESSYGTNVVTVCGGEIAVTEADCPEYHCVSRGFCHSGAQIVCLPNRLVIRFTGEQKLDGISG